MLASVATWLQHFHGPTIYVICGLLVFGEAALLLGFIIPGETAALVGGALASFGGINLEVMLVVVVVCAIVGDSTGYEVGKVLGPWLLERRLFRSNLGVHKATSLIARFGGPAVFLGRWVALARALVPGLSGMSGMRYRTFLFFNALGGLAWGTTFVLVGYAAGKSYSTVASRIGIYALLVVAAVVVAVGVRIYFRRRREARERSALEAAGELGRPRSSDAGSEESPVESPHTAATADAGDEAHLDIGDIG
ncbi:MAG TPA: DedA family protein [Acidimicrobiales bacterium]|nr:DedA family protein [Acidimicrobiales bacterium]